jgi:hypothetical protein
LALGPWGASDLPGVVATRQQLTFEQLAAEKTHRAGVAGWPQLTSEPILFMLITAYPDWLPALLSVAAGDPVPSLG